MPAGGTAMNRPVTIFALARQRRLALIALYLRGVPATSPVAERYAARMSREQLVTIIAARGRKGARK